MAEEKAPILRKFILITGGNSGIGLEACKIFCNEGHKVVTTVRSREKGEHCLSEVRKACSESADIHYMLCELTNPSSIRNFVQQFKEVWLSESGLYLDVLVNNAGVVPADGKERTMCSTQPEWEIAMATNCIAPVLITDLLLDNLKQTSRTKGEARVVMVNSSIILDELFNNYKTDFEDPMMKKRGVYKGSGNQAYKNSKMCLMLATLALVDELQGTNVRINSMCPGIIPSTQITRNLTDCSRCCFICLFCCVSGSPSSGGEHIAQLAIRDRANEGCGLFFVEGDLKDAPPRSRDKSRQQAMLAYCRGLISESSE